MFEIEKDTVDDMTYAEAESPEENRMIASGTINQTKSYIGVTQIFGIRVCVRRRVVESQSVEDKHHRRRESVEAVHHQRQTEDTTHRKGKSEVQ